MFGKLLLACFCLTGLLTTPLAHAAPELQLYTFTSTESRILPGKTPENRLDSPTSEQDRIGRLLLVALKYQSGHWTDGRYNHNNFPVETGSVSIPGQEQRFDAFRLGEPQRKAIHFLGSHHTVFYRFPYKANWTLYQLTAGSVSPVTTITESEIVPDQYTRIMGLSASKVRGTATYFLAPAAVRVSNYTQLNSTAESAVLADTPLGKLQLYRHRVNGIPPDPGRERVTLTRQFFLIKSTAGPGVIWQDKKTLTIYLTRFTQDLHDSSSVTLAMTRPGRLLAACSDPDGNLYYLLAREKGDAELIELVKTDASGKLTARIVPDGSPKNLNLFSVDTRYAAAELAWSKGQLCMMLMRTMHKSADGLNHQGGIAVIFDANDLHQIKNLGQTSGHSFDNVLNVNSAGEFIGIDLGDNYPRGINLHRLGDKGKSSRVVYTFKTSHAGREMSPSGKIYPPYPEISTPEKTYYKWSNDNGTYTELGGLIETPHGYMVIFAGEPSPDGKVLDNSRVGGTTQDMRNIGLVVAVKNFYAIPSTGNVVSDQLLVSKGLTETGGFYTFGGAWSEQRSTGVVWLTHYTQEQGISARHIKTAALPNGTILILWQANHQNDQPTSWAMTVTPDGKQIQKPFKLPQKVELNRRDALMVDGNRMYIASGDREEKKLELFVLQLK